MTPFLNFLIGLALLGLFFWYFATDHERRKRMVGSILVAAIASLCLFALIPPKEKLKGGIDIVGGTSITVRILDEPYLLVRGKVFNDSEREITGGEQDQMLNTVKAVVDQAGLQTSYEIAANGNNGVLIVAPEIRKNVFAQLKRNLGQKLREITRENVQNKTEAKAPILWKIEGHLSPESADSSFLTQEAMEHVKATISKRVNPDSTRDIQIYSLGRNRLVVEAPGLKKEERSEIRRLIEKQATLELRAVHPENDGFLAEQAKVVPGYTSFKQVLTDPVTNKPLRNDLGEVQTREIFLSKRVAVEGEQVTNAQVDYGQKGVVLLGLSNEGAESIRNLTSKMTHGRDRLAIVVNGQVTSAPTVNSTLGKRFEISGLTGKGEASDLATALNNPLRNPLLIEEANDVSAKLGAATVKQGVYAGIAGLLLTFIFILLYYRVAGIVALLGLLVNVLMLFGLMAMFGFTFTLPGIAGIVLTIGVAVDANVLIYERLREELEAGKSLKTAIRMAYEKAFSSILDANITTLLTALILFWRASETVKGFAITLTIGILASMFTALLTTRVLFRWTVDTGILKNLSFANLLPKKTFDFMSKGRVALIISSALLAGSLAFAFIKGEQSFGVDFIGGTRIAYQLEEVDPDLTQIDQVLKEQGISAFPQKENNQASGNLLSVRCASEDAKKVTKVLKEQVSLLSEIEPSVKQVGATLGEEFKKNSLYALGLGLIAILIYITVRFEFSFAVGAFVALFHDIIICVGIVLLLGTEISLIHVGAFLTVAGYSINDTIIIFDRIREFLQTKRGETKDLMNEAVNATLSRTILTSVTTFVSVLVLWFFGGSALKDFSVVIMIGVIVGTYSSIFVASPLVLFWSQKRGSNLRRELLDANLEAQVTPARK